MARIDSLSVSELRSIQSARLSFSPTLNVIDGLNGSGKTSLLESIFMLSATKSFRPGQAESLVRNGQPATTLVGDVTTNTGQHRLGLQLTIGGQKLLRLDGNTLRSSAEVLRLLPVMVINSDSFNLATGSPGDRRKFVDWGVFHVEHRFLDAWRRAQRALKQRNSLIRRGSISDSALNAWEQELAQAAGQVDGYRKSYVEEFSSAFSQIYNGLTSSEDTEHRPEIILNYRRGWDDDSDYGAILRDGRRKDVERGFTRLGPHRAELKIKTSQGKATELLSRGQLKILIVSLKLAQAECVFRARGERAIYLVDDLPAELDPINRKKLFTYLADWGGQVFITAISREDIESDLSAKDDIKMFHVEQGVLSAA